MSSTTVITSPAVDVVVTNTSIIPDININVVDTIEVSLISNSVLPEVVITTAEQGPEGAKGDSAYAVWLSDGNTGTVDDYLLSIKGDQGVGLEYNWDNTFLGVKTEEEALFQYTNLKGDAFTYDDMTPEQKTELASSIVPTDANYTNVFLNALLN